MPLWLIPMAYTVVSLFAGLILPRLEHPYLPQYIHGMSVAAGMAFFSAVSSGMMALTGIVFAIAFVVVQFSALASSPRIVVLFASSPLLFHALGIFFATFTYSLVALVWTDRSASGTVPLFSYLLVATLLIISMLIFAKLIQSVNNLQIHNVLQIIGSRDRAVIRAMFTHLSESTVAKGSDDTGLPADLGQVTQTITYSGEPYVIARLDIDALVRLAQSANAIVVFESAVGDTLVEDTTLLRVHSATRRLSEEALKRAVHLSTSRTFEQDPKYAIRLLGGCGNSRSVTGGQ
jgi:uncharacterized membrane protein